MRIHYVPESFVCIHVKNCLPHPGSTNPLQSHKVGIDMYQKEARGTTAAAYGLIMAERYCTQQVHWQQEQAAVWCSPVGKLIHNSLLTYWTD